MEAAVQQVGCCLLSSPMHSVNCRFKFQSKRFFHIFSKKIPFFGKHKTRNQTVISVQWGERGGDGGGGWQTPLTAQRYPLIPPFPPFELFEVMLISKSSGAVCSCGLTDKRLPCPTTTTVHLHESIVCVGQTLFEVAWSETALSGLFWWCFPWRSILPNALCFIMLLQCNLKCVIYVHNHIWQRL